jgi:uncharacterized protein YjeT (DUF2065 family)
MKRAAERSLALPSSALRVGGLAFVLVGVIAVWMIRG